MTNSITLKAGKERSLFRRHPWVFEGSIAHIEGRLRPGDNVTLLASDGRALAKAAWSPRSQIRARVWTFNPDESVDHAFFKRRVTKAYEWRRLLPSLRGQAGLRVLHGESDGLPGVIADLYGDTAVVQLTSTGAEKWRQAIVSALVQATGCRRVYERSDSEVRRLEGLEPVTGWLYGDAPAYDPVIEEYGIRYHIDVIGGHKTGYYLDQRENRRLTRDLVAGLCTGGKAVSVLNCFCYTGGFSLQALAGGAASVLSIDSSGPALEGAQRNLKLNPQLPEECAEWLEDDVFLALRRFRTEGRKFDLIVLDPPKFAPSAAHVERAARAYKDVNLLGLRLLNPGGLLMTYSCSGGISAELLQKIVAGAAIDAGVDARILQRLSAAADHPVGLTFPEGEYLKGLVVQVN